MRPWLQHSAISAAIVTMRTRTVVSKKKEKVDASARRLGISLGVTAGEGVVEEARGTCVLSGRRTKAKTKAKKKRSAKERRASAVIAVIPHRVPGSALSTTVHLKKVALAASQGETNATTMN